MTVLRFLVQLPISRALLDHEQMERLNRLAGTLLDEQLERRNAARTVLYKLADSIVQDYEDLEFVLEKNPAGDASEAQTARLSGSVEEFQRLMRRSDAVLMDRYRSEFDRRADDQTDSANRDSARETHRGVAASSWPVHHDDQERARVGSSTAADLACREVGGGGSRLNTSRRGPFVNHQTLKAGPRLLPGGRLRRDRSLVLHPPPTGRVEPKPRRAPKLRSFPSARAVPEGRSPGPALAGSFDGERRIEWRESVGLKLQELRRAQDLAREHRDLIVRRWHEHLG